MEVKLQRNLVLQELSILQGVVEHRTTIPILANILAETADDRLRLVATDLDMTILTDCAAAVHSEGRLTLRARSFRASSGTCRLKIFSFARMVTVSR